jgi:hypothetical protein
MCPIFYCLPGLPVHLNPDRILAVSTSHVLATALFLTASAAAQTAGSAPQVVLDNDIVRVLRVTIPARDKVSFAEKSDAVAVHLLVELKRHMGGRHYR